MFDVPKGQLLVFPGEYYRRTLSRGHPSTFAYALMFCDASHHAPTVTIHEIIDFNRTMFTHQWESPIRYVMDGTISYPGCESDRTSAPRPMAKDSVNMYPWPRKESRTFTPPRASLQRLSIPIIPRPPSRPPGCELKPSPIADLTCHGTAKTPVASSGM